MKLDYCPSKNEVEILIDFYLAGNSACLELMKQTSFFHPEFIAHFSFILSLTNLVHFPRYVSDTDSEQYQEDYNRLIALRFAMEPAAAEKNDYKVSVMFDEVIDQKIDELKLLEEQRKKDYYESK